MTRFEPTDPYQLEGKVPIEYTDANGVAHNVDMGFVKIKDPSHEGQSLGVLASDPKLVAAMQVKGPFGLGEATPSIAHHEIILLDSPKKFGILPPPSELGDTVAKSVILLNPDGTIEFNKSQLVDIGPVQDVDRVTTQVVVEKRAQNQVHDIDEALREIIWDKRHTYQLIPELRKELVALGYGFQEGVEPLERTWVQIPSPQELQRRLDARREAASAQGIYLPHIVLLPTGNYTPSKMNEIFASGRYPVSAEDIHYYLHDTVSNHFEALLVYGEPLVEILSRTCLAANNFDSFVFEHISDNDIYKGGNYSGKQKDLRISLINEFLTDQLSLIKLDQPMPEEGYYMTKWMMSFAQDAVNILRANGTLSELSLVQALKAKGISEDKVTGYLLMKELVEQTQERHGIVPSEPGDPTSRPTFDGGMF